MFQIIEVFLGFSIGIAVLWVTIVALVKFTRRVMRGEEWQDGRVKRFVEETIKRRSTHQYQDVGFGGF
jgi:hypothetical protein